MSLYVCLERLGFWKVELFWIQFHFAIFPSWYVKFALSMYLWVENFWTWNWQDGSDSERERNEASESRKPVKRKREKVQLSVSKDPLQAQTISSSDGCLSLLKKRRLDGKIPVMVSLSISFSSLRESFLWFPCPQIAPPPPPKLSFINFCVQD